jgi:Cysteine-rich secretory protein family
MFMVKNTINRTSSITIVIALLVTAAAILTVQSLSMLQPSYAQLDATQQQTILDMHNQERAAVGVAPLTWSDSIAAGAQDWANSIASRGVLEHSPRQSRPNQGENLAWGSSGGFTVAQHVQGWADEKSNYVPGTPIASGTAGPGGTYGHYTQMVWSDTTEIGCGMASAASGDYLVCRYSPSGNWIGEVAFR